MLKKNHSKALDCIKIAIVGATGRMGMSISKLCKTIEVGIVSPNFIQLQHSKNPEDQKKYQNVTSQLSQAYSVITDSKSIAFEKCDIIIDFSSPDGTLECAALNQIYQKLLVSGTTGFTPEQEKELENLGKSSKIVWASNTSIGVNVLFEVSKKLSELFGEDYDAEILERHHSLKQDSPSGTAVTLGKMVAEGRKVDFEKVAKLSREGVIGARQPGEIGFQVARHGNTIGYHELQFWGQNDRFWIGHESFNRDLFAQGAIRLSLEAHKSLTKNGFYTFGDIFNIM